MSISRKALMSASLAFGASMFDDEGYLLGDYTRKYTTRTGKGRKRTITTAQQKRDKTKRKNKGK